jgi:hypothetical protein
MEKYYESMWGSLIPEVSKINAVEPRRSAIDNIF